MNFLPLSRLLTTGRPDDWHVAVAGDRDIGFAEFRNDVARNATRLRALRCRRGLLIAKDAYWAAVGILSLLHAKAVVVLPSHPQAPDLQLTDADQLISDDFLQPAGRESDRLDALDPEQSRIELFTSGSTGQPKRIAKSLREMEAEAGAIEHAFGRDLPIVPVFGTVPHHHLYGLSFRIFWPLMTGRPIIATTHVFWEQLATALTPGGILVTSPAHLMRIPPIPELKESRLRLVFSAGAVLPDDGATAAATALGCAVTDIFGSTETGVVAYRSRNDRGAPWRAFPGVAVRRLEDGRMSMRADHLAGTDWHDTADVIALHENGTFDLLGRADRVVKIEGHRISLADLEAKLHALPLVREAAVVALETSPASLGAAVVLTPEGHTVLQETGSFRLGRSLRNQLAQHLPLGGLPRHWRFLPCLPSAALGKRRDQDVAGLFAARRAIQSEPILRTERRADDTTALDLFIPADLRCLRGHFPGLPVVPGVAQLDWAVKLAARHFDLPIAVANKVQIKFKRILVAPADVTLALHHRSAERQITFEYTQGEAVVSQGRFVFDRE